MTKKELQSPVQLPSIVEVQNNGDEKVPIAVGLPIFICVVVGIVFCAMWAYEWLQDEQRLPVQEIVFSGDLNMLEASRLEKIVREQAKGSFFALDVNHVHGLMEREAWVFSASVRKRWPSKLYIHIVEQKAVAKWNDDLLLNKYGDTFNGLGNVHLLTESRQQTLNLLPQLFGPGGSEKTALTGYTHMQRLLNTSGQRISQLVLSERFAWQARLTNQIVLKLGRQEYVNRLQRFIDVYPLLSVETKAVEYVDLRYDTGIAVGWGKVKSTLAEPNINEQEQINNNT